MFVAAGFLGLLAVGFTTLAREPFVSLAAPTRASAMLAATERGDDDEQTISLAAPGGLLSAEVWEPITRLRMPRIRLDTPVVPAPYIEADGGTWEIPSFVAGHAERTAGAGQRGNAVLFGHVTSRAMGNVFEDLSRARVSDTIEVFGTGRDFVYEVTEVRSVPRTEVSVLGATASPSLTLITCTGPWLPLLNDYAERLIVRAQLIPAA